ncbi:MAG TPA: hypothetical protein GXZ90_06005 [Clostridiales bacterium]|nr:hypothetical protein [Clostridiales bacterium]
MANELNLDTKVTLRNLANWTVGFKRIESNGDCSIPAKGTTRVTRNEVIAQVQNGNKLLAGVDNIGSHATVIIQDAPTRVELDFESEDGKKKQRVLTDDVVKTMFEYKTMKTFEKHLEENVVTRAEKFAIIEYVKNLNLNDYEKIRAVEKHTGLKVD